MVKKEVNFVNVINLGEFHERLPPLQEQDYDSDDEKQQEMDDPARASGGNSTDPDREASSPGSVPGGNGDAKDMNLFS